MSLSCGLCDVFVIKTTHFWQEYQEVTVLCSYLISGGMCCRDISRTGDMNFGHFAEVVFFSLLPSKVSNFPFVSNRHFVGDTLRPCVFVLECYITNYTPPN